MRGAVRTIGSLPSAGHVTRTSRRHETFIAKLAVAVRVALSLLKPRVYLLLVRDLPLLASFLPPRPTLGVLTAVVRVRRAVRAVRSFAAACHVTRAARRHETLIAVLALAVGVTFPALVARHQLPHRLLLARCAPLLPPRPSLGVLTAVVRVRSAVRAVGALPAPGHVTRAARRHETVVTIVALAACTQDTHAHLQTTWSASRRTHVTVLISRYLTTITFNIHNWCRSNVHENTRNPSCLPRWICFV